MLWFIGAIAGFLVLWLARDLTRPNILIEGLARGVADNVAGEMMETLKEVMMEDGDPEPDIIFGVHLSNWCYTCIVIYSGIWRSRLWANRYPIDDALADKCIRATVAALKFTHEGRMDALIDGYGEPLMRKALYRYMDCYAIDQGLLTKPI